MLFGVLLLMFCMAASGARWEIVYFHDEDQSELTITDLKFPSATRGVATGIIRREDNDPKPVVLATSDGGAKWSAIEIKDPGLSLFFLTETHGWMVTPSGIWFTAEAGRSWTRILKRQGLTRVHFVTPELGFAIGAGKTVLRTRDGGKTWKGLPEAKALNMNEDSTIFHAIGFGTEKFGIIAGQSRARRPREHFPIWMDPEASRRREWPSVSVMLQTKDGGVTWNEEKSSLFGRISQLSLVRNGRGMALLEFDNFFDVPSEVFCTDPKSGKFERCFRRKDFAVTDVAVAAGGPAFVAGFQPLGLLARTPVPGKVRISSSADFANWIDLEIDYRAVARRVVLAVLDKEHAWAATDSGMILRLRP